MDVFFGDHIKKLLILFLVFVSAGAHAQCVVSDSDLINFQIQFVNNFAQNSSNDVSEKGIEFFPNERVFPKIFADGTAQQFSLNKDLLSRRFIGAIGSSQRILQFYFYDYLVQVSLGATVYASLYKQPDVVEVHTACFFVDLPFDIRLTDNLVLRTGYGHYSAHLADDGVDKLNIKAINYAKDYIPLITAYKVDNPNLWLYGGIRFDTYTIPEYNKRWNIQIGIEGGDIILTEGIKLYGAVDIKFKSEAAWGSTQSYQAGLKFFESESSAIRFAYTYRTGLEDRGQFYTKRVSLSLIGLYFDF
ncbi:MAG: DUF1207 domain-containing protein [bacterium]